MFYSYFLSASALAAVSLGAALYAVTGHGEGTVDGAQPPTSADRNTLRCSLTIAETATT